MSRKRLRALLRCGALFTLSALVMCRGEHAAVAAHARLLEEPTYRLDIANRAAFASFDVAIPSSTLPRHPTFISQPMRRS